MALSEVIKTINKKYGKDVIKTGDKIQGTKKVTYGEPALDWVYSGGVTINRVHEKLGVESTGKTRDSLVALARFQTHCFNCHTNNLQAEWEVKDDLPVLKKVKCTCKKPLTYINVIVDYESTIDIDFLHNFGINPKGLIYVQPSDVKEAVNTVDAFLRSPEIALVLFDSIGLLSSDAELEKAIEDNNMNSGAREMNRATRKWQSAINEACLVNPKAGNTLIVINRMYTTISMYSTDVPQGGGGLKHMKSTSVLSRIKEKHKDKEGVILGIHRHLINKKNKTGLPYRTAMDYLNLDADSDMGYCKTNVFEQYVEFGEKFGIIVKAGGWYKIGEEKMQGRQAYMTKLKEDTKLFETIKKEVDKVLYGA